MNQTATKTLDDSTLSPVIPALIAQVSLTAALLLFIRDLWTLAPLDSALMTAGGSGAILYAALMAGYVIAKRAMIHAPTEKKKKSAADTDATTPAPTAQPGKSAPAPTPVARTSETAAMPAPPIPA
jgi:hypothetical protein